MSQTRILRFYRSGYPIALRRARRRHFVVVERQRLSVSAADDGGGGACVVDAADGVSAAAVDVAVVVGDGCCGGFVKNSSPLSPSHRDDVDAGQFVDDVGQRGGVCAAVGDVNVEGNDCRESPHHHHHQHYCYCSPPHVSGVVNAVSAVNAAAVVGDDGDADVVAVVCGVAAAVEEGNVSTVVWGCATVVRVHPRWGVDQTSGRILEISQTRLLAREPFRNDVLS